MLLLLIFAKKMESKSNWIPFFYGIISKNKKELLMALRIKNGKVVSIAPPKLTKKQLEKIEQTPVNNELIKEATSRKYNIVYR